MCGLAGIVGGGARDGALLRRMGETLAHRGPDDDGFWSDEAVGIAFAHRRLAIVDLSAAGHQPMASRDGRWVIAYNGEIYNHAELRAEIDAAGGPGSPWRGHSDTETIVEGVARWGLAATLTKCVGMFAIALWDRRDGTLSLARDRFGEKPLYFGWVGGDFMFASELKALRIHPRFANAVDRRAMQLLASRAYIPAPLSIYREVYKLEPGTILTARPADLATAPTSPPVAGAAGGLRIEPYWSYRNVVAAGLGDPIASEDEALERLEAVLATAIRDQAIADVPVGAFLSGGIDSSTVVALYQKYSSGPVRTFTIGFEEASFNEAPFAKAVAAHFGTDHTERYVSVREAEAVIPQLPAIYDEPFADSSQIPTYLVSRLAREQVTVALSGDGGDELFCGYNRYVSAARAWARFKQLPSPARAAAGKGLGALPPGLWNRLAALKPGPARPAHFGHKVQKGLRTMGAAASLGDVFASFIDEWPDGRSPVLNGGPLPAGGGFDLDPGVPAPDAVRMMYADAKSYLPDDILCKVDRAAMAVSLETRVPFLDHRVAELAARIPLSMKIEGGKGKAILRKLLYREAPMALFERPKAGFGIPIGEWLKTSLRDWAESLINEQTLTEGGHFDASVVRARWQRHLSGEQDSTQAIWTILMFQAWLAAQRDAPAPATVAA